VLEEKEIEESLEQLRKEGYQSEDELEDYLTQDIIDFTSFKTNHLEHKLK